ncbi:MAG: hypothetical protein KDA61_21985, partial [Planctomycetales bacterium]|nr:hypothetical protein [Planctomycetales bacterium]
MGPTHSDRPIRPRSDGQATGAPTPPPHAASHATPRLAYFDGESNSGHPGPHAHGEQPAQAIPPAGFAPMPSPSPTAFGQSAGMGGLPSCPGCGWQNQLNRGFCAGCGRPLWEPCLACGATIGSWERFCGACGLDISSTAKIRLDELQAREREAMEHLKSGRASQAMALLYEIASANHPRFSEMARRAVDLQQRIGAEAERQARSLEQVSARAASFAADSRFREAAELLHSVPREQRTSEMAATLARCEEKLAEIRDLKEQVRRLAGAGEVGRELVDLLHALRNLTPHDSAVSAACEKAESRYRIQSQRLCQNAVKAAEAFLAQKAYAKAVAVLDRVPESFRSATWRDRQREASFMQAEYEFLARHLRGSKVVDGATRSLLRRLSELAPGDGPAKQLAAWDVAIQRRVERGLSPPSVWTAAPTPGEPQRIPFGKLTGVQVSNDALAMRDQFGVFAVALGL